MLGACSNVAEEIKQLPEKENVSSSLMSDSPINASNIEDYLFLENNKYLVKGIDAYRMDINYNWEALTKVEKEK